MVLRLSNRENQFKPGIVRHACDPELGKLRHDYKEFKVIFGIVVSSRLASAK